MSTAVSPGVVRRRILDLGCGSGQTLSKFGWRLVAGDEVVGVDIQLPALHTAHLQYPERSFLTARAELLPFRSASFEAILCHIALPYMDIPAALTEMARVLVSTTARMDSRAAAHWVIVWRVSPPGLLVIIFRCVSWPQATYLGQPGPYNTLPQHRRGRVFYGLR